MVVFNGILWDSPFGHVKMIMERSTMFNRKILWYVNIVMEAMAIEIVDLSMKHADFPWLCDSLPEGISQGNRSMGRNLA